MRISVAIAVLAACGREPRDLVVKVRAVESHVALERLQDSGVALEEGCGAYPPAVAGAGALLVCGEAAVSVRCDRADRGHPETIQAKSGVLLAWCE